MGKGGSEAQNSNNDTSLRPSISDFNVEMIQSCLYKALTVLESSIMLLDFCAILGIFDLLGRALSSKKDNVLAWQVV